MENIVIKDEGYGLVSASMWDDGKKFTKYFEIGESIKVEDVSEKGFYDAERTNS